MKLSLIISFLHLMALCHGTAAIFEMKSFTSVSSMSSILSLMTPSKEREKSSSVPSHHPKTRLSDRIAEPVLISMSKAKMGVKALARSVDEFQVEYNKIMGDSMEVLRQRVIQSTARMVLSIISALRVGRRMALTVVLQSRNKVRTVLQSSKRKGRTVLRRWIHSTIRVLRAIQKRLDRDASTELIGYEKDDSKAIAATFTTDNSLLNCITSLFATPSSPLPSSPIPLSSQSKQTSSTNATTSSSPTWLSSPSKRAIAPVVAASTSSSTSTKNVPAKQKRKVSADNSLMMEQLAARSDQCSGTDIQAVPSSSLLGGMLSTLLTGLFFVAGGVMIGYFWNDWRDVRNQAAGMNNEFVEVRIVDGGGMSVTTPAAALVDQDAFYRAATTTATAYPVTPEAVRL